MPALLALVFVWARQVSRVVRATFRRRALLGTAALRRERRRRKALELVLLRCWTKNHSSTKAR